MSKWNYKKNASRKWVDPKWPAREDKEPLSSVELQKWADAILAEDKDCNKNTVQG